MEFLEKDCTNKKLCSKCKGRCCKETGCFFMPSDFKKIEFRYLKRRIDKGYISISKALQFEGIELPYPILYLKIRNVNSKICCISERGKCMLLTKHGCKLNFKKRPSGGKALIPGNEGQCKSLFTEKEILTQWKPHQEILKQLWKAFSDEII